MSYRTAALLCALAVAASLRAGAELSVRGNEIRAQVYSGLNKRWLYLTRATGGP